MKKSVKGYAKINLHLDIRGIRDDGYHDVETVMQTLTLCDTVTVEIKEECGVSCDCSLAEVPTDERNIAVRAALLYLQRINSNKGIHVSIEKNIPMAAGLAGGSTDAAATLIALNRLFENKLAEKELLVIGSKLGADVPFCIRGGCAYTDGKGDILHDFPALPKDVVFVVACGGEGVSTPWAYRLMDEVHGNFIGYKTRGTQTLKNALLNDPQNFSNHLFNIFEEPVLERRPIASEIKKVLLDFGARAAMMSGSGPSVFAVFENVEMAKTAVKKIKDMGHFASLCYATDIE